MSIALFGFLILVPFVIYDVKACKFVEYPYGYSNFIYGDDAMLRFYQYVGEGDGQLTGLIDIAIDSNDNVYILKYETGHIQVFTYNMTFLHRWNTFETDDDRLKRAFSIAIDSDDMVYVADGNNSQIKVFTSNGTFLYKWGSNGIENGQFDRPYDIAIDSNDIIYVADDGNSRIQAFTTDGTFLHKWGSNGTRNYQFQAPTNLAIDSKNNVYVMDKDNARIQVFDSDGMFLHTWGSGGIAYELIDSPTAITIDSNDNLYILEGNHEFIIKMFAPEGTLLNAWTSSPYIIGCYNTSYPPSCPDPVTRKLCIMLHDNNIDTGNVITRREAQTLITNSNNDIYLLNRLDSSIEIIKPVIHHSVMASHDTINTTYPQTSINMPQERFNLFNWIYTALSSLIN